MKKSTFYVLASVLSIVMMFVGAYFLVYMKDCTRTTLILLTVYCLITAVSSVSFYEMFLEQKELKKKNINN